MLLSRRLLRRNGSRAPVTACSEWGGALFDFLGAALRRANSRGRRGALRAARLRFRPTHGRCVNHPVQFLYR